MTRLMSAAEVEAKSASNRAAHAPRRVNLLEPTRTAPVQAIVKPKKNKYSAIKMEVDGFIFDSRKEARRYEDLKLLEAAGEIKAIERQVRVDLSVGDVHICDYVADFRYNEKVMDFAAGAIWKTIYEDVKGYKTAIYRLKKKMVLAIRGIEIRET